MLVLGGTGYVGGRLIPRLLAAGYRVRVLVRSRERILAMPWAHKVEICEGDASETVSLQNTKLSPYLASRVEVAKILLDSSVPTIVLQAGAIIGSGSASFEMVRHLTEVLPYMPAPRWVRNFIQPIAIRDVLYYLLAAARISEELNREFDIGGPDVLRYGQMMNPYALEAGLPQRHIAALPVLTPRLASHWVDLVTPVPHQIVRPLVESLQNDCVMSEHGIDQ